MFIRGFPVLVEELFTLRIPQYKSLKVRIPHDPPLVDSARQEFKETYRNIASLEISKQMRSLEVVLEYNCADIPIVRVYCCPVTGG